MTGLPRGRKGNLSGGGGDDDEPEVRDKLGQLEHFRVGNVGKKCLRVDAVGAFSSQGHISEKVVKAQRKIA